MRSWITGPCLALMLAAAAPAKAQVGAQDPSAPMRGALRHTPLSVHFDRVPARDALDALSRAIAIPIVGRFTSDRDPSGLDPQTPVSIRFERAEAVHVLEAILEQCEEYEPCTWQLRGSFIEVGTKARLSVPAASETRVYPIRDLMIDPPYFKGPSLASIGRRGGLWNVLSTTPGGNDFDSKPYASAVISKPAPLRPDGVGNAMVARKRPEELAREYVQSIVEMVEPGNWDYGQSEGAAGKIARLRLRGDQIIVNAPGYVHRQIVTPAVAPAPRLTEQERADRSALASVEGGTIVVLPPAPRRRPGGR